MDSETFVMPFSLHDVGDWEFSRDIQKRENEDLERDKPKDQ
jgi:hypothetical protein